MATTGLKFTGDDRELEKSFKTAFDQQEKLIRKYRSDNEKLRQEGRRTADEADKSNEKAFGGNALARFGRMAAAGAAAAGVIGAAWVKAMDAVNAASERAAAASSQQAGKASHLAAIGSLDPALRSQAGDLVRSARLPGVSFDAGMGALTELNDMLRDPVRVQRAMRPASALMAMHADAQPQAASLYARVLADDPSMSVSRGASYVDYLATRGGMEGADVAFTAGRSAGMSAEDIGALVSHLRSAGGKRRDYRTVFEGLADVQSRAGTVTGPTRHAMRQLGITEGMSGTDVAMALAGASPEQMQLISPTLARRGALLQGLTPEAMERERAALRESTGQHVSRTLAERVGASGAEYQEWWRTESVRQRIEDEQAGDVRAQRRLGHLATTDLKTMETFDESRPIDATLGSFVRGVSRWMPSSENNAPTDWSGVLQAVERGVERGAARGQSGGRLSVQPEERGRVGK